MSKRILLIGGSLNQTTIMSQIARELAGDGTCFFSAYYADGWLQALADAGLLDSTILGGQARRATLSYLEEQGLRMDDRGKQAPYDLVVTASDLIVPRNIRNKPVVLVQEGMLTPENLVYRLVRYGKLPRYLANTAMTGLSGRYRMFCTASEGFRNWFIRKGADPNRVMVTGIPNFDNVQQYRNNDLPYRDFVLSATSCLRETGQFENRRQFILKSLRVADGRPLIFKLHPNENHLRARREIEQSAPDALVLTTGNTNHLIANCQVLLTRYSSVLLTALALGKEVHSDLDPKLLESLRPVQNGGTSAASIARICREFL